MDARSLGHVQARTLPALARKPPCAEQKILRMGRPPLRATNQITCEGARAESAPGFLYSLKEVIQPHVPVRLPCYDFTLVTDHTVVNALPKVRLSTSGATNFHGVTGGVYKTRERIHRTIADIRLLAIPTSRSRVADFDPD